MNIVSKRAGNNWAGNASGYFVNHDLQGNNTPDELVDAGIERSNRINEVWEWGFDVGGPIVKDRLFAWGAYRRNQINLFTRNVNLQGESIPDDTTLKTYNSRPISIGTPLTNLCSATTGMTRIKRAVDFFRTIRILKPCGRKQTPVL